MSMYIYIWCCLGEVSVQLASIRTGGIAGNVCELTTVD